MVALAPLTCATTTSLARGDGGQGVFQHWHCCTKKSQQNGPPHNLPILHGGPTTVSQNLLFTISKCKKYQYDYTGMDQKSAPQQWMILISTMQNHCQSQRLKSCSIAIWPMCLSGLSLLSASSCSETSDNCNTPCEPDLVFFSSSGMYKQSDVVLTCCAMITTCLKSVVPCCPHI